MLAVLRSDQNGKHSTFLLVHGTLHPIHANPLEVIVLLSLYLAVLDDQSNEEQFIDQRYFDLRTGFQPDHMEAGTNEPCHPWNRT